ncbi:MAG: hypothetical protein H6R26_1117 [Proteobacteria bacterium]|nr:hypothetical protein [Pseudomonadota bacterium]
MAARSGVVGAEEGGSGHYLPGAISSFVDSVPLSETFIARLNVVHYDGDLSKTLSVPIAGNTVAGARAKSDAIGLTFAWRPSWGGESAWSYAMSATIPFVWMDVSGDVEINVGPKTVSVQRSDSVSGLGDIVLMPLMLNYNFDPDFNVNFRVAVYAPTGSYQVGRLANTGKNFWTIEPTLGLMYFGKQNGIEASLFLGTDFNQENPDTHYQSGTQVHLDGTLAQHFPLWGGLAGAGVTGFWYQQVTGDSGAGATFGDFRAQTNGVGPAISYAHKAGSVDVIGELKWLHELGVEKRLSGDTVFLKVMAKF